MGNVRLRGHDYHGKGYYFITFGTLNRRPWLSRIEDGRVVLEPAGELVLENWRKIAGEDPAYDLGVTAVMPDHFHGLAIAREPPKYVIGTHVSRVEGRVLHAMRKRLGDPELKLWDEGFYDYISLDINMLRSFEAYIADNPVRWQLRGGSRNRSGAQALLLANAVACGGGYQSKRKGWAGSSLISGSLRLRAIFGLPVSVMALPSRLSKTSFARLMTALGRPARRATWMP